MTPIQTKTMSDLSDRRNNTFDDAFSRTNPEAEEALRSIDRIGTPETSTFSEAPRRVVTTEMANGEPISPRDLFSSDRAYELAANAAKEQVERSYTLKNIGERIASLRENF